MSFAATPVGENAKSDEAAQAVIQERLAHVAPGIPVVKVGTQRPVIPADIELSDQTTVAETMIATAAGKAKDDRETRERFPSLSSAIR